MKEKINKILFPLNVIATSIGLINLADDIYPALIKAISLLKFIIEKYKYIRDLILKPITIPIDYFFNIELLEWWKSYLFLGFIFFNTYNYSYKNICGSFSPTSLLRAFVGQEKIKTIFRILFRIILWPLTITELFEHYKKKGFERKKNVLTRWTEYLFWVLATTIIIILINWFYLKFSIQIK